MRVIIPCWIKDQEILDLTENCINSLRENEVQITIIDNGSPMGGGLLRQWADEYVRNPENLGYAKAVNQGIKLHRGELVAVVNNDTRISKNWIEVAESIMQDPTVCSVHFRMIPYDQPFNLGSDTWKGGKERWCSSSFFVMQAELLYDEHFFNTYDDWDMWKSWREKGFKQVYTNKVEYQHMDSSTAKKVGVMPVKNMENREYFKKKWGVYPEEDFEKQFSEQMKENYRPFP